MPPFTPPASAESGKDDEEGGSSDRGLQQTVVGGKREAWAKLTQHMERGGRTQYGIKTARNVHGHSSGNNCLTL